DGEKQSDLYFEVSKENQERSFYKELRMIEGDKVIMQCRANRMKSQSKPELIVISSTGDVLDVNCTDKCILKDKITALSFLREVSFPAIEIEGINNTKLVCRNPNNYLLNDTV
ncbi:unnamed protein product, partial [Meganyctiphanes norvegica]